MSAVAGLKITAGLGSIDDYEAYADAGADELFAGYVPGRWLREAGAAEPLNRREVMYVNVQLGTASELEILEDMVRERKVPVKLTFNSPFYRPERYPLILDILKECMSYGFRSFIVADPVLILKIREENLPGIKLYISGEMGEATHYLTKWARAQGVSGIIFPRKTTLQNMQQVIRDDREHHPEDPLCFEAFALNEKCHFSGSYCMSCHSDFLEPTCRLPYVLREGKHSAIKGRKGELAESTASGDERTAVKEKEEERRFKKEDGAEKAEKAKEYSALDEKGYIPGATGCGLCSLWQLKKIGVNTLKLVSRGQNTDDTVRDIRALKRALFILDASKTGEEYLKTMREDLFPDGCSGNCYYPSSGIFGDGAG